MFITTLRMRRLQSTLGIMRCSTPASPSYNIMRCCPLQQQLVLHRPLSSSQKRTTRRSLYEELGVPSSATVAEIRMAYFKLAVKVHPDVNDSPEAAEEFRRLDRAYRLLTEDASQRQFYDDGEAQGGFAEDDPRWALYEDPEGMRNRWRALVRDRSVMREAVAAELREADEDLKELGEGLSRGDLRAVAAFARHQPLLTSAVAAPVVAVALLTRYPPLALALLKVSPVVRFWGVMLVPWTLIVGEAIGDIDVSSWLWQKLVDRARARQERRKAKRLAAK